MAAPSAPVATLDDGSNDAPPTDRNTSGAKISAALMVLCILVSWPLATLPRALGSSSRAWLLPFCGFLWIWSIKNVTMGPLKKDLGILTNLLGVIAGLLDILESSASKPFAIVALAALSLHWAVSVKKRIPVYFKNSFAKSGSILSDQYERPSYVGHVLALHVLSGMLLWLASLIVVATS